MPYIKPELRVLYQRDIVSLSRYLAAEPPGHLAYVLYSLALNYLGKPAPGFGGYNEVLGVLEGLKLEFYRAQQGPYEACKQVDNGGVYPWNPNTMNS